MKFGCLATVNTKDNETTSDNFPNKAHSHNMMSIQLLQICVETHCKTKLIFRQCSETSSFPSEWECEKIAPI